MSIAGKHSYRFVYLKSEQWSTVRIEALARESGKCQICAEESIFNDAHHIWYPENIYETRQEHLAILCRACHDLTHALLAKCKTGDKQIGMNEWTVFRNAIITWRTEKFSQLKKFDGVRVINPQDIHLAISKAKGKLSAKASSGKPINKECVKAIFSELMQIARGAEKEG